MTNHGLQVDFGGYNSSGCSFYYRVRYFISLDLIQSFIYSQTNWSAPLMITLWMDYFNIEPAMTCGSQINTSASWNVINRSKSRSFDLSLCLIVLFGQQVVILSSSITGTFKDQELSTPDSKEQSLLSTAMPSCATLRLVSLVVTPQSFNCKK